MEPVYLPDMPGKAHVMKGSYQLLCLTQKKKYNREVGERQSPTGYQQSTALEICALAEYAQQNKQSNSFKHNNDISYMVHDCTECDYV